MQLTAFSPAIVLNRHGFHPAKPAIAQESPPPADG